jgi:hypothetical protein
MAFKATSYISCTNSWSRAILAHGVRAGGRGPLKLFGFATPPPIFLIPLLKFGPAAMYAYKQWCEKIIIIYFLIITFPDNIFDAKMCAQCSRAAAAAESSHNVCKPSSLELSYQCTSWLSRHYRCL